MLDRSVVQQLWEVIRRYRTSQEEGNAILLPLLDAHPELAHVRFADYQVPPGGGANLGYAIHEAVTCGYVELTKRMIALGADVNGHGLLTPLEDAHYMYLDSIPRRVEMLELLLESGADPNQPGSEDRTILHNAIRTSFPMTFVPLALHYGADPNRRDKRGYAPLHHWHRAAEYPKDMDPQHIWHRAEAYLEVLDTMVSYGADINAASGEGWTVLMTAVKIGGEAVSAVLRHGADVHAKTLTGWTALHTSTLAYDYQHGQVFTGGRWQKPDLDASPLAHDYQLEEGSMEMLLAAGASCHAMDERGYTPLHVAASCCDQEGARLLLAAGADINALSHRRQTPLDMVEKRKNPFEPEDEGELSAKEYRQMAAFLRERGATSSRGSNKT